MGKLLVLSVSDCEEHIFNRIMAAIIDEPELDRIALPLSAASLSFPDLEIRLKEQTVSCRGQLVTLTHHEFAVLAYLARHPINKSVCIRGLFPRLPDGCFLLPWKQPPAICLITAYLFSLIKIIF